LVGLSAAHPNVAMFDTSANLIRANDDRCG
jgi:hypothetical protein